MNYTTKCTKCGGGTGQQSACVCAVTESKPDIRLHNDGQDLICMNCGTVIHRTRTNPFPKHECKSAKDAVLAKWPDAYSWQNEWSQSVFERTGVWKISTKPARYTSVIGNGYTEPEAWADAARRLTK